MLCGGCGAVAVFALLLVGAGAEAEQQLSPEKSFAHGVGLNSDLIAGVYRYFEVVAVDTNGNNFTHSPKESLRVWMQGSESFEPTVLDRKDGTFLVRWIHTHFQKQLKINVKFNGKHVQGSPFTLKNALGASCDCPVPMEQWEEKMQCGEVDKQIIADLNTFPQITRDTLYPCKGQALIHYTILDNRIYGRRCGDISDFRMFSDFILLTLTRVVKLPDMEFVINVGDYPRVEHRPNHIVVSWCGSDKAFDVILPQYKTYDLLRGSVLEDYVLVDAEAPAQGSWEEKLDKMIWRGRDANQERIDFVKKHKNSEDIDAQIVAFFFFREMEEVLGVAPRISFTEFFRYKYLLNIDGTVAAYRLASLLAGDSLVFKQASPYYEHFYHKLKPWKHFVPVSRDLKDVPQKMQWAREHDKEAQEISRNARLLIRENLQPHQLLCYHTQFFREYAKRLTFTPKIHEGMEELTWKTKSIMPVPPLDKKCICPTSAKELHTDL